MIEYQRYLTFAVQPAQELEFGNLAQVSGAAAASSEGGVNESAVLKAIIEQANEQGLFTFEFQHGYASFFVFWYFFASFLVSCFALLYYRKYRDN